MIVKINMARLCLYGSNASFCINFNDLMIVLHVLISSFNHVELESYSDHVFYWLLVQFLYNGKIIRWLKCVWI